MNKKKRIRGGLSSSGPPHTKSQSTSVSHSSSVTSLNDSAPFSNPPPRRLSGFLLDRNGGDEDSDYFVAPPSRNNSRRSEAAMKDFTINKLRFSALGLHGREKETTVLTNCLDRLNESINTTNATAKKSGPAASPPSDSKKREMVFISGVSGIGKSRLADFLKGPVQKRKGLYASGKFDLYLRDEPYFGVATACQDICREIVSLKEEQPQQKSSFNAAEPNNGVSKRSSFQQVREALIDQLGDEASLLIGLVPQLNDIIGADETSAESIPLEQDSAARAQPNDVLGDTVKNPEEEEDHQEHSSPLTIASPGMLESKNRFNFAFRRFFRVVASFFAPLVLMLDDCQWADVGSLELLLEVLLTDRENPGLLLMACYRSNEVEDTHILARSLREVRAKEEQYEFNLTEIEIGDLPLEAVNKIVMDLLATDDDERTEPLAKICHKKTHGNAFFLLEFLSMLQKKNLLEYNIGLLNWVWDVDRIEAWTQATNNVVDMMKAKMHELPPEIVALFPVIACLGSTFDTSMISLLYPEFGGGSEGGPQQDSEKWFSRAIEDGYMEAVGPTSARWVHDKIQEAAMSLLSADEMKKLKIRVGESLVRTLSEQDLEASLFVAVNLLNEESNIAEGDDAQRINYAKLNLRAAVKATSFAAFESAAKYASKGIELLPSGHWENFYHLSLDLYSTAVETQLFTGGDPSTIDRLYRAVMAHTKKEAPEDRARVCFVMIRSLGNQNQLVASRDLSLRALGEFGCKFPKTNTARFVSTMAALMRFKKLAESSHAPEEVLQLPFMEEDPVMMKVPCIVDAVLDACFRLGSNLLPLMVIKEVETTYLDGVFDQSPSAFALLGIIFVSMGKLQVGSYFATCAVLLLEKVNSRAFLGPGRTKLVSYAMVLCWTRPMSSVLQPLQDSYQTGLRVGDILNACWSIHHFILCSFLSGKPLRLVEGDCRVYARQMVDFKQLLVGKTLRLVWQSAFNLMGLSDCTVKLSGEAMDEDTYYREKMEQKDQSGLDMIYGHQVQLCAFFGEHEYGARLALENRDSLSRSAPGYSLGVTEPFYRGICLFSMARKTRKRKYKRAAQKARSKIKAMIAEGNPNVVHHDLILEAEAAALAGKKHAAMKAYTSAIVQSARLGFVHDAALANERYGDFLLHDMADEKEAAHYLKSSVQLYSEWGARAKVTQLSEKYSFVNDE